MDRYRVRLQIVVDDEVLANDPAAAIAEAKAIGHEVMANAGYKVESTFCIDVRKQGTPIDCRAEFAAVLGQHR